MNEPTFSFPVRPDHRSKLDSLFLDRSYYRAFQSHHSGWDYNLRPFENEPVSGANRDRGYPISNTFPGDVIFSGRLKLAWGRYSSYGRVVKVRTHPVYVRFIERKTGIKMDVLDTVYCHLYQVAVEVGQKINSGEPIGGMGGSGKGEYSYPTHLHLAFLKVDTGDTIVPRQGGEPTDKERILKTFVDPAILLGSRSGKLSVSDQPSALHPDREFWLP